MTESDDLLPVWRALAESKRRQIIELLELRPHTTSELCQYFDVSRFAVMKHLNVLEQAGLITFRREGRLRWNTLSDNFVQFLRTTSPDRDRTPYELSEILGIFPKSETIEIGARTPAATICLESDILLHAPRDHVFHSLTEGVDQWWSHRASADSIGVFLEPFVGGRFYEAFDSNEQGELYATVTYVKAGEEIRFHGPMGVADTVITNRVRIILGKQDENTQLKLIHQMIGEIDGRLIGHFGQFWDEALNRSFKAFVEKGIAYQTVDKQVEKPNMAVADDCEPKVSIAPTQ